MGKASLFRKRGRARLVLLVAAAADGDDERH